MTDQIKLSQLVSQIQETIQDQFEGEAYWVSAQITNVKKYETNRRCYLTLEEYADGTKTAEVKAVFWSNYYTEIEKFERLTNQTFKSGIEIICKVKVRYHQVYGLNLDVLAIDVAHTLGTVELERKRTLDRLLTENPKTIQFFDEVFITYNNRLALPVIIRNIALITAPNSDGQRDFLQEIAKNKHGFTYVVHQFLTTIQGENAHQLILEQLIEIEKTKDRFDVVAIVRGGGSQTDFKPFEDYELSRSVAHFPIPVFTGIGHDRNQSIVDLMAREQKTPTKVASLFIDHNFDVENELISLKARFFDLVEQQINDAKQQLNNARRIVKLASPQTVLSRGFAIVKMSDKILTNTTTIHPGAELQTIFSDGTIYSTVTQKLITENGNDL